MHGQDVTANENHTVDPIAGPQGLSVDNPLITEVMNRKTGTHHNVIALLNRPYGDVMQLRRELTDARDDDASPPLVCSICQGPVFLRGSLRDKRFTFAHFHEDGTCPAVTRGSSTMEEMDARKYNGAKESDAHKETKRFIIDSLRADSRFDGVVAESIVKNLTRWRRPDVRALLGDTEVFIEAQLATTHLPVILARQAFYRQRGSLLAWVFRSFREEGSLMTQDDIFYFTRNLFVVSAETVAASRAAGAFMLDCHWAEPVMLAGRQQAVWKRDRVSFHDLKQDRERGCVYYFDYDGAVRELEAQVLAEGPERIKREFEAWWWRQQVTNAPDESDGPWQALRGLLRDRGIVLPYRYGADGIDELMRMLFSVKAGKAHGRLNKWISSVHCFEGYRSRARLLRVALVFFNRLEQLRREDATGAYARRSKDTRARISAGDPKYDHDAKYDELVRFLFPGLLESHPTWLVRTANRDAVTASAGEG